MFRITYINRSFLDYRIPVFAALDKLTGGRFHVIYSKSAIPDRVNRKIENLLGDKALGLAGEIRFGAMDLSNFANSTARIVYQPGILAAIRKTSPDVIIGEGFFQWTSFALLYRIIYRTPIVICYERTFHTERNAQWYRTYYRKIILRWVDAMSCNGSMSAAYAQWLGMPSEYITLGHMSADTEGLEKAIETFLADDRRALRRRWGNPEIVFLVVARLIERKGIHHLLTAWEQGERTWGRKAALVIVGDGPQYERLLDQVQSAGMKRIYFEGAVDYDHIAPYYASSDAFVIPTLEDNWSLVVPEAMACGLPILCSKYNGCWPELVQEGNGWVFDPLNHQGTFEVMNTCIAKLSTLPTMGQRSREIIAGHSPMHAAKSIYEACRIAIENFKIRKQCSR